MSEQIEAPDRAVSQRSTFELLWFFTMLGLVFVNLVAIVRFVTEGSGLWVFSIVGLACCATSAAATYPWRRAEAGPT